jgi:HK97 family phage prohead protease
MQYKTFDFEIKSILDNSNDKYFEFEGYASVFGIKDSYGDVVVKGAFSKSLEKIRQTDKKVPTLWQHKTSEPIGIYKELKEDDRGLFVVGIMPKDDSFVSGRVMPQMRIGAVRKMSIGYSTDTEEWIDEEKTNYLKEITLHEVSIVTFPALTAADITNVKSVVPYKNLSLAPRDMEWDSGEADKRIRKFTGSDEKPSAEYKNAFFWYDNKNAENFGAYKLPYADVVDGKLKAVPRGIFASAGGRGVNAADIPDADKKKVIANINKYYKKMAKEFDDESIVSPFEKSINIEDFKNLKEVENYIKDFGLSNKDAKTLISKIKEINAYRDDEHENNNNGELRDVISPTEVKALNEMLEEFKQLIEVK